MGARCSRFRVPPWVQQHTAVQSWDEDRRPAVTSTTVPSTCTQEGSVTRRTGDAGCVLGTKRAWQAAAVSAGCEARRPAWGSVCHPQPVARPAARPWQTTAYACLLWNPHKQGSTATRAEQPRAAEQPQAAEGSEHARVALADRLRREALLAEGVESSLEAVLVRQQRWVGAFQQDDHRLSADLREGLGAHVLPGRPIRTRRPRHVCTATPTFGHLDRREGTIKEARTDN